jgi:hypothetical protein
VVDQIGVEVFDLLLRELDVFEPAGDLVVVRNALLETFLNELLQFLDSGREISTVSNGGLPPGFAKVDGDSIYLLHAKSRCTLPPAHLSPSDITEVAEKAKSDF